ncbi:MAG TPA: hypothetical protein VK302_20375 [Terriglobales bacterium]|nr:hypothetical protein [Terriglobales bacterium]
MTGKERNPAKLRCEPTDSRPLMSVTMIFAADLADGPRGTPHANLKVMRWFGRSRS